MMMFETKNITEFNKKLKKVSIRLGDIDKEQEKKMQSALLRGAIRIHKNITLSMRNTARASHFYMRGGKKHYPSAEGNPPAIDRGGLVGSLKFDATERDMRVGSTITNPNYPKFLEEGTKKMKKRPWLEPAYEAEVPGIVEILGGIFPGVVGTIFRSVQN